MKIVITIEVPDGVSVSVGQPDEGQYVPPFEDELIPLPQGAVPVQGDPQPYRAAATVPVPTGLCPIHKTPWRMVPAGVSKKTGKPYAAFLACSERGCDQRPAA